MNTRHRRYSAALGLSLAFALLAPKLLQGDRLGVDFILLISLLLAGFSVLKIQCGEGLSHKHYFFMGTTLIFLSFLVLRASLTLYVLNLVVLFLILVAAYLSRQQKVWGKSGLMQWVTAPYELLTPTVFSVAQLFKKSVVPLWLKRGVNKNVRAVISGLLVAAPLLLVFGSLLMSADSRFEQFIGAITDINIVSLLKSALHSLIFWPCFAVFFLLGLAEKSKRYNSRPSPRWNRYSANGVQIATVLICVNMLFLSYLFVQSTYFLGGEALIQTVGDMTYSSYARNGFFELVWLAVFVLPVLLISDWLVRQEGDKMKIIVKRLMMIMLVLVMVMECSAVHRMILYVLSYGLTELRFYASVFMFLIVVALALVYFSVMKGDRQTYGRLLFMVVLGGVFILNVINPNTLITAYNLSQLKAKPVDLNYLERLGVDAMPTLVEHMGEFPQEQHCQIVLRLQARVNLSRDWYDWHLSKVIAAKSMAKARVKFCR